VALELVGEELWSACSLGVNKGRVEVGTSTGEGMVGNYKEGGIGIGW
jgi:hypothetical protein